MQRRCIASRSSTVVVVGSASLRPARYAALRIRATVEPPFGTTDTRATGAAGARTNVPVPQVPGAGSGFSPSSPSLSPLAPATATSGGGPSGPTSGGRGGGGGGGGSGQPGGVPPLPSGWTWSRLAWLVVGLAAGWAIFRYIDEHYIHKPEPKATIDEITDTIKDKTSGSSALSRAGRAVKHATVDPVRDAASTVATAVGRVERKVEHAAVQAEKKIEKAVGTAAGSLGLTAEKAGHRASEAAGEAKIKAHEAKKSGEIAVDKGKAKLEDAGDAVSDTAKAGTRGLLEGVKNAVGGVGKGLRKAGRTLEYDAAPAVEESERKLGVRTIGGVDRRVVYGAAATVATAALLGGAAWWDKSHGGKGDPLVGFKHGARLASDKAQEAAKAAKDNLAGVAPPPSGPGLTK